jgi:uncharacterized membrane protein YgcG
MNNLYEALEICLQDIEQGADVESVLFRYPDLADELRPILEASTGAKNMAVAVPSTEVVQRNRARVLQHAAQMREGQVKSSQRMWFVSLRRIAVTLAVVATLFVSGTGLVGASSNTLPGDNLYPVKRTWEGVRLLFTFNLQDREALEVEHENERLYELKELFAEGRSAEVDFRGLVTSQNGNEWIVAGVRVLISSQTDIRDPGIAVGSAVRVRGVTQGNAGTVIAERVDVLSSDAKLPDVDDEHESEPGNENNSGPGNENEKPRIEETQTSESESESESENSNSGSGNENGTDENKNENDSSHSNSNDDNSGKNENGGSDDNSGGNDNGGSDDNGNGGGGGDDSGGGDNSGSGGGGGGEED